MLDLIFRIFITTCLAYVTLNTFIRFHISIDRILLFLFIILFLGCIIYLDTKYYTAMIITVSAAVILTIFLKIISIKKQKHGYFFFNIYKKDYQELNNLLNNNLEEFDLEKQNLKHSIKKPWLVVLSGTKLSHSNKFIKKIDKIYAKKPKKLSMYNYWFVIGFLTLVVIIWRF